MAIVTDYEIASANLFVALSRDSVSTEQREQIAAAVGDDLDLMIQTFNAIIVSYNKKAYDGTITFDKAEKFVKAEYKAIGFDKILSYTYFDRVVHLFYTLKRERDHFDFDNVLTIVREMVNRNDKCPVQPVKDSIYVFALRIMSAFDLVGKDLEFTEALMKKINEMSEERKETAAFPHAILTEI